MQKTYVSTHYRTLKMEVCLSVCSIFNEGGEHIDIRHNSTSGIIELKYNNEWRPVSASFWSQEDARVACKELGLPYSGKCMNSIV